MAKSEAGPLRLMLTLGVAGLLSGFLIVGIFILTKPRIERNEAEALHKAVYIVVPGSSSSNAFLAHDGKLEAYDGPSDVLPKEPAVYAARDDSGKFLGYAVETEGAGFQDTIKLIFGYDPVAKKLLGMRVLESRETPGLGDKITKDQAFIGQFAGVVPRPKIEVTKKGKSKPNEIDAITGATISSKAVARIISEGGKHWLPLLDAAPDPPVPQGPEAATPKTKTAKTEVK